MNSVMIILLSASVVATTGPLQRYSYDFEDFVIFNDVGSDNNVMYVELVGGLDILFLENTTDPSLYRIEIIEEKDCVSTSIYNDVEGEKLTSFGRKVCKIEEEKKALKLNWDRTKVTIHHNDKMVFHFSNEIKFRRVRHISIRPKFHSQVNFKNTYTFIARFGEICPDTDPVLVCHLEMIGDRKDLSGVFMRADFFKAKSDDDYEIKAILNANDSFFGISKNTENKLRSVVRPLLNRKINFIVDTKRHHTSIHNPNDIVPLLLWNEEDASYMESFTYVIVQNLKLHNSTFSEINNSNNCEIKCFEKGHPTNSFWSKAKTFVEGGLKIDNYCANTDYLRD